MSPALTEMFSELLQKKISFVTNVIRNWDNFNFSEKTKDKDKVKAKQNKFNDLVLNTPESPIDQPINLEIPKVWGHRDLRIQALTLSGFRSLPSSVTIPFGLKFIHGQNGTPFSAVLLGSNGSGKTSLYSAIELACLGKTSIAEKHKIQKDKLHDFYTHIDNKSNNNHVRNYVYGIYFADGTVAKNDTQNPQIYDHLDLRSFFCSESDISIFECSGDKIEEHVDDLLGLTDLTILRDLVSNLKDEIEQTIKSTIDPNDKGKLDFYDKCLNESIAAYDIIDQKYKSIRDEGLKCAHTVLMAMVEDYFNTDTEEVEPSFDQVGDDKLFDGKLKLKSDTSSLTFDPRFYFNNFRFKLYVLSLRVAIAFYTMQKREISFPLMFDDIFDSSDFKNRVDTKNLFIKIEEVYNKLYPNGRPIQILFFTQDDVVAEAAYKGLKTHGSDVKMVRIYPHYDHKNTDIVSLETPFLSDQNDDSDSEALKKVEFYNLYDVLRYS